MKLKAQTFVVWLFKTWRSNTTGYLFLGLFITFIFAFCGQLVMYLHYKLFPTIFEKETCHCASKKEEYNPVDNETSVIVKSTAKKRKNWIKNLIKSVFVCAQYWWAAIDMLLIMTYNIYVIIALSLGIAAGYYCFGYKVAEMKKSFQKSSCCH